MHEDAIRNTCRTLEHHFIILLLFFINLNNNSPNQQTAADNTYRYQSIGKNFGKPRSIEIEQC